MPKYFFNVRSKSAVIPDDQGQELPNLDAARGEAIEGARDVVANWVKAGHPIDLKVRFEIADEAGQVLQTVLINDAIEIET